MECVAIKAERICVVQISFQKQEKIAFSMFAQSFGRFSKEGALECLEHRDVATAASARKYVTNILSSGTSSTGSCSLGGGLVGPSIASRVDLLIRAIMSNEADHILRIMRIPKL